MKIQRLKDGRFRDKATGRVIKRVRDARFSFVQKTRSGSWLDAGTPRGGFSSLEEAIAFLKKTPGASSKLITSGDGRFWNVDGKRVRP